MRRPARYIARALGNARRRGDTCAYRVSQIFPSLFDKYRVSSRSTEPQRHENRIRETARGRARPCRHNTHSTCATMRRVVSASCAYTLLSLSFSLLCFCFSRPRPLEGASSALHVCRGAGSSARHAPARVTREAATEGNFSEKSIDRTLENVYVSPLHLSFFLSREI